MNDAVKIQLALLQGVENMAPVFDAAEGMKSDLERRGWSPTVAESIAHQWVIRVINMVFNPATQGGT